MAPGIPRLPDIAKLPIHAREIDRSFIVGITEEEDSRVVANSLISLVHSLRLKELAESVETEVQAALRLNFGCDRMQGYLFSPPVPPEQIADLVRQQQRAIRGRHIKRT